MDCPASRCTISSLFSVFCFSVLHFYPASSGSGRLPALTRGVRQNADNFPYRSNNTRSFRRPPPDDPYRPPG